MTQTNIAKIEETTREFFGKTGLEIEAIEIKFLEDASVSIDIKAEEPGMLIGEQGQTLAEIQRLLKIILQKGAAAQPPFYIDLDINDYKKKKKEQLREIARSAADEVSLTKKEKQLSPMSAFERRVVHMELASRGDVATESIGQEPERRVAIKPGS